MYASFEITERKKIEKISFRSGSEGKGGGGGRTNFDQRPPPFPFFPRTTISTSPFLQASLLRGGGSARTQVVPGDRRLPRPAFESDCWEGEGRRPSALRSSFFLPFLPSTPSTSTRLQFGHQDSPPYPTDPSRPPPQLSASSSNAGPRPSFLRLLLQERASFLRLLPSLASFPLTSSSSSSFAFVDLETRPLFDLPHPSLLPPPSTALQLKPPPPYSTDRRRRPTFPSLRDDQAAICVFQESGAGSTTKRLKAGWRSCRG